MGLEQVPSGVDAPVLAVRGLEIEYGPVVAATEVSLHLNHGEIVALLGPNGAGKTSVLKGIMGLVRPSAGRVDFTANNVRREITGWPTHEMAKLGIAIVPSAQVVLPRMTVEENLLVGGLYLLHGRRSADLRTEELLDRFPILARRRTQLASSLSGGEQRLLAIARGLMSKPRLMLLDEPSLGLSPILLNDMFELLQLINREDGVDILMVEQNVRKALELADRAYVMNIGGIEFSGTSDEIAREERLKGAFLGI